MTAATDLGHASNHLATPATSFLNLHDVPSEEPYPNSINGIRGLRNRIIESMFVAQCFTPSSFPVIKHPPTRP